MVRNQVNNKNFTQKNLPIINLIYSFENLLKNITLALNAICRNWGVFSSGTPKLAADIKSGNIFS